MPIVAIGGSEKEPAIRAALDISPNDHNHALIIPTACSISASYERKVPPTIAFFLEKFGLITTVLHTYGERPTQTQIAHEVGRSTLIYTIGGNTPYLLEQMSKFGLDRALTDRLRQQDVIHAGVSAGALLPFNRIHTNPSASPSRGPWDFEQLDGLGVLKGIATAHAQKHDPTPAGEHPDSRMNNLLANFPTDLSLGLAIDDGAAVIIGQAPQVVLSRPGAGVYVIENDENGAQARPLKDSSELMRFIG